MLGRASSDPYTKLCSMSLVDHVFFGGKKGSKWSGAVWGFLACAGEVAESGLRGMYGAFIKPVQYYLILC